MREERRTAVRRRRRVRLDLLAEVAEHDDARRRATDVHSDGHVLVTGCHPFTAPAVSPVVIRRWTIRKNTITGSAMMVEPAITPPQSVPRAPSLNACNHTGNVWLSGRFMMTRAKMNSFHAWMKANTPVATRPGATSGSVTVTNARSFVDPSTCDASSSSFGTPPTKPRNVQ